MKKIVIIGASDLQNPLIIKAKKKGYETHVFAWKAGDIGEKTADFFYPISITEKEQILEQCKKIKPDGIASIASDLAMITVNYVAYNLKLVGNPLKTTLLTTNKYQMRKALKEYGIAVPYFKEVRTNKDLGWVRECKFPLIVKPTDRSGSRAISKVYTMENLKSSINNAISASFEKKAIIEEFIEGEEYSCECLSYKKKHFYLATTKKCTTGEPNYIETAHFEPANLKFLEEKIKCEIFKALDALEIENGASHSEFKIDSNGEIKIIEIGARMGGDFIGSDLVRISTGYDYLDMIIDIAVGLSPSMVKISEENFGVVKYIIDKNDLLYMKKLKKQHPEIFIYISDIKTSDQIKIVDSSTRYGYYILCIKDRCLFQKIQVDLEKNVYD